MNESMIINVSINYNETSENIQNNSKKTALLTVYTIIGFFGILGNGFVLIIFYKSKILRRYNSYIYIVNQSLLDFFSSIILISAKWIEEDIDESKSIKSKIGKLLFCHLWYGEIVLWGSMMSSTYNLVVLSLERFLSVVYPISHKLYVGKKLIICQCIIVWFFGIGYEMTYHGAVNVVFPNGNCGSFVNYINDLARQTIGIFTLILQFFLPLIILLLSYGSIWRSFRSTKVAITDGASMSSAAAAKEEKKEKIRKNTIKTLSLVAIAFVICWSWNEVYFLIFNLGYDVSLDSPFYHFTVLMVFINCCINPIVYMARFEEFKKCVRLLFLGKLKEAHLGAEEMTQKTDG